MGYMNVEDLRALGLAGCGRNVRISDRCVIHGARHVRIGDHVRIDDLVIITAEEEVSIGSHVHVGAGVFLAGRHGISLGDFAGLSPGVAVFSATDDFSGEVLTGPTVPDHYRRIHAGRVRIGRHVVVGARSVVLPGVTVAEGAAVGALSLVTEDLPSWSLYAGIPARFLKKRSSALLDLEARLHEEEQSEGRE